MFLGCSTWLKHAYVCTLYAYILETFATECSIFDICEKISIQAHFSQTFLYHKIMCKFTRMNVRMSTGKM